MNHTTARLRRRFAYVVIDTDGQVCWGLVYESKREASDVARHPKRQVARIEVTKFVRKLPRKP